MKKQSDVYCMLKCPTHSSYRAKRKPRQTKKFPKGCLQCWLVWHSERGF